MRRTIALLLALLIVLSFAGCKTSNEASNMTHTPDSTESTKTPENSGSIAPSNDQGLSNETERKTLDEFKEQKKLPTPTTVLEEASYVSDEDGAYLFRLHTGKKATAKTYYDKYISAVEEAGFNCQFDEREKENGETAYWLVKNDKPLGAIVLNYYDYEKTGLELPIITVILFK